MSRKPRQFTAEEQRQMVIDYLVDLVEYTENDSRQPSLRSKLELVAFSFLTMLDGCAVLPRHFPLIDLVARAHPDDPEYNRQKGENWWPTHAHLDKVKDYEPLNAGKEELHDLFMREVGRRARVRSRKKGK